MKTNREVFTETLQKATTEEFVRLTTGCGKCGRCSNHFWDGSVTPCHQNINNSNCNEGYAEWLESYVGEDLQEKYNKKYWYFRDHTSAQLSRQIVDILYSTGTVDSPAEADEKQCSCCTHKKSCTKTFCYMYYQHLHNLRDKYIEDKAKEKIKGVHGEENQKRELEYYKEDIGRSLRTEDFIVEVLIPQIKDERARGKAELLVEFKKQYSAKLDAQEEKKE